jgi:hypothetical protein
MTIGPIGKSQGIPKKLPRKLADTAKQDDLLIEQIIETLHDALQRNDTKAREILGEHRPNLLQDISDPKKDAKQRKLRLQSGLRQYLKRKRALLKLLAEALQIDHNLK